MSDRGQMDPNLMGPAGLKPASQEACHCLAPIRSFLPGVRARRLLGVVALQHLPERYSLPPALAHRHAVARPRIAVDRTIDRTARVVGRTPGKGEVAALERRAAAAVSGKLRRQRRMRAIVLG